jgi:protein TonB
MFESTLSAQGLNEGQRRFGSLLVAMVGHVAVIFAIFAGTLMVVPPPPNEPHYRLVSSIVSEPPLDLVRDRSNPPPPKKGTDAPKAGKTVAPPHVDPELPPMPTTEIPASRDVDPTAAPSDGPGDGTLGDPHGSDDGVKGGNGKPGDGGDGTDPGGGPVYVTGDMVSPKILVKVEPTYPEVARMARLGGRVTVKAVIGLDGNVESAEIFASTSPLFDRAALDAVTRWRYRPALMNGRPVRVYFTVMVDFSVR